MIFQSVIIIITPPANDNIDQMRPRFTDWLANELGTRRWSVEKRRTKTWKGFARHPDERVLLPREYDAFEMRYEQLYGPKYPHL